MHYLELYLGSMMSTNVPMEPTVQQIRSHLLCEWLSAGHLGFPTNVHCTDPPVLLCERLSARLPASVRCTDPPVLALWWDAEWYTCYMHIIYVE